MRAREARTAGETTNMEEVGCRLSLSTVTHELEEWTSWYVKKGKERTGEGNIVYVNEKM